jgi:hypothetical protein
MTVRKWYREFESGRVNVMDEQRGIKKKHKRSFGRESSWNPREYSNGNWGNK